ncbi:hypothetical protein [Hyalangium minutum]|uniref:Uncharacterized protein n=1 Tax=Hyalangium minutum TaxID=394096 RepID=A0A085WXR7_9BACT|nr:hypothetical protein [Hyalangium minutum]KFE72480.1 hypothetical protein DB31_0743 [Hyalangium minutum]
MSEQVNEGGAVGLTPSKRDILERAWSKYWYFAEEALPGRVEELLRLLPAARTYGLTAPLENFLKRHTDEVLSIVLDVPLESPERRASSVNWTQKLIAACTPDPQAVDQFCIPALPEPYMSWLQGTSLLQGFSSPWQGPLHSAWLNHYLDDPFASLGFIRASELLEKLRKRPVRPPDFHWALRRFRAYLRLTLPKGAPIPSKAQLEQFADEHLGPRFEQYLEFLAPIAARESGVFTWQTKYG